MEAYRLVVERSGEFFSLQHKKARPLPLGEWLEADVKLARDGSGDRWYKVGFHSIVNLDDIRRYREKFREPKRSTLRIVRVTVTDTWEKSHSPYPIVLSRFMRIEEVID